MSVVGPGERDAALQLRSIVGGLQNVSENSTVVFVNVSLTVFFPFGLRVIHIQILSTSVNFLVIYIAYLMYNTHHLSTHQFVFGEME